ncbi:hypothetical protein VNO78_03305 [Psophocarpus tetragonolobus]|uniref:Strictosidine synthase n=1 Tax=Psophocarpus tetragonolobus TaxID=3891 RepID=A0AAN9T437_PSOTE
MTSNLIRVSSSLVLAVLVALTIQIFYFSPIDRVLLDIKPASSTKDNHLQNIIKLGEGLLKGPEDVCVDKEGTLYAVTRDGWIKRLRRNGNWENWKHIDSGTMLGITPAREGGLIVCDATKPSIQPFNDLIFALIPVDVKNPYEEQPSNDESYVPSDS